MTASGISYAYTVRARFAENEVAEEWLAWLRDEHLDEVLDAGALGAEVIRMDGAPTPVAEPVQVEVRYHFASASAFRAYERDHAPRLRAQGLARFPAERGVSSERSTGAVVVARRMRGERGTSVE